MNIVINFSNWCFDSVENGFGCTYLPVETARPYSRDAKKRSVFEVKLCANGKRTRLHFSMRESSNCVEYIEEKKFYFSIVPHTFLRFVPPTPTFTQTCTIIQKHLIFRGFKCNFCHLQTSSSNVAILRPFATYVKS